MEAALKQVTWSSLIPLSPVPPALMAVRVWLNLDDTFKWSSAVPGDSCWQKQEVALVKVETPSFLPYISRRVREEHRWASRKGEGLAAEVLAVFSGIHYLACLKIHQRLPPFQHMVHLNFTASCFQPFRPSWGAAWSTVHQGKCMRAQAHMKCHRWGGKKGGMDSFN